jgi:hypothetical protein
VNTYISPRGERQCRACHRKRELARYHRKALAERQGSLL